MYHIDLCCRRGRERIFQKTESFPFHHVHARYNVAMHTIHAKSKHTRVLYHYVWQSQLHMKWAISLFTSFCFAYWKLVMVNKSFTPNLHWALSLKGFVRKTRTSNAYTRQNNEHFLGKDFCNDITATWKTFKLVLYL